MSKKRKREDGTSESGSVMTKKPRPYFDWVEHQQRIQAPPPLHGQKRIPIGTPNCLNGLTFVLTGTYDSLTRDEAKELIQRYGGRITSALSGKTTHLVAGQDAGESKTAKAKSFGTRVINEDGLLQLIEKRSTPVIPAPSAAPTTIPDAASTSLVTAPPVGMAPIAVAATALPIPMPMPVLPPATTTPDAAARHPGMGTSSSSSISVKQKQVKSSKLSALFASYRPSSSSSSISSSSSSYDSASQVMPLVPASPDMTSVPFASSSSSSSSSVSVGLRQQEFKEITSGPNAFQCGNAKSTPLMWVDKYKPIEIKDMIGNTYEISRIRRYLDDFSKQDKLLKQLDAKTREERSKTWTKRALLIIGPPGTGKTTAAHVVAKACGYHVMEVNASDARNKQAILDLDTQAQATVTGVLKCLIVDEVDGMSGNADRGGLQALSQQIKTTCIPILCICNDAGDSKFKTLKNHCKDVIVWRRATAQQIMPRMLEICKQEQLQVDAISIRKLVDHTRSDIRQMLHVLEMWKKTQSTMTASDVTMDTVGQKDHIQRGLFELIPDLFRPLPSAAATATAAVEYQHERKHWLNDRLSNNYFADSDMVPLLVQEQYIRQPFREPLRDMSLISEAADSITDGDMVYQQLHREQDWGEVMPVFHGITSSIAPGWLVSSSNASTSAPRYFFPTWLGQQSSRNKHLRQARELSEIMMKKPVDHPPQPLSVLSQDYLPCLRHLTMTPLLRQGSASIPGVASQLQDYSFVGKDVKTMLELTEVMAPSNETYKGLDAKLKNALTRKMNQGSCGKQAMSCGKFEQKANTEKDGDDNDNNDGDHDPATGDTLDSDGDVEMGGGVGTEAEDEDEG